MNMSTILSISPILEVAIRNLYWRFNFIYRILSKVKKKQKFSPKNGAYHRPNAEIFSVILNELVLLGIKKGDLVIVHTSELKSTGVPPDTICNSLINLVGSEGTLAMPAIPFFRGEVKGPARIKNSTDKIKLTYDVKRTPPWTGFVPLALMRLDGAIRSQHPLNTMVAVGKYAKEMMQLNIEENLSKGCGLHSPWKFCADRNAKILFLDVDPAHCLTMIHVLEDSYSENGYAPGWYRERLFRIIDGPIEKDITVKERHPKWAMYFAERTLQKDLIKSGVLKTKQIGDIQISLCESSKLIDFLNSHHSQTYPYWIPFWRRFK